MPVGTLALRYASCQRRREIASVGRRHRAERRSAPYGLVPMAANRSTGMPHGVRPSAILGTDRKRPDDGRSANPIWRGNLWRRASVTARLGTFIIGSTNGVNHIFRLPIENGTSTTVPWSDGRAVPPPSSATFPYLRRHGLKSCDAIFLLEPVSSLGMVNVGRQNALVVRSKNGLRTTVSLFTWASVE